MKIPVGGPPLPTLLRAARQFVLVLGVGALGAALCSTGALLLAPAERTPKGAGSPPSSPRALTAADVRALSVLRRAARAEAVVAYQGAKMFTGWSTWGHTETLAYVRHVPGRSTTVTAGQGARGLSPAGGSEPLVGLPDAGTDAAAGLGDRALDILTRRYALAVGGAETMLERPVTRIDVRTVADPDDGVVARFWVDDGTGLILRRELVDGDGAIVRRTWFVDLDLPTLVPVALPSVVAAHKASGGRPLAQAELDRLRRAGTVLPGYLPGGMLLVGAREVPVGDDKAIQLSYSDGLFSLSVFAQRGALDPASLTGFTARRVAGTDVYTHCGLSREITWAGGGTVWTVVTDAPDAIVTAVIGSLPSDAESPGILSRMSRGADRVGSWVDPFH